MVDVCMDRFKLSKFAISMLVLCIAIGMAEGYDVQVMALAAPMVGKSWAISPHDMGLLLTSSVVGTVIGSFTLSPFGDRLGRRVSIVLALPAIGLATLLGGFVTDVWSLLATRFVVGLGLGLAFPNVATLAMELMSARLRSLAVVLVSCGIPLGSTVGGIFAANLVDEFGYPVIFFVGGIATLAVWLVALVALPESPLFLARDAAQHARLGKLLYRLGVPVPKGTQKFGIQNERSQRSPVTALFEPERRTGTILLWALNLANMAVVYYQMTWLPSTIAQKGASAAFTIRAFSVYSAGGIAGGVIIALLLPRFRPVIVLTCAYVLAVLAILALSALPSLDIRFLITLALCGAVVGGSQFCLNAVVNLFYPSTMRATASGYATGVGRISGIAAPAIGGLIMGNAMLSKYAISAAAVPASIALVIVILLQAQMRSTPKTEGAR